MTYPCRFPRAANARNPVGDGAVTRQDATGRDATGLGVSVVAPLSVVAMLSVVARLVARTPITRAWMAFAGMAFAWMAFAWTAFACLPVCLKHRGGFFLRGDRRQTFSGGHP